MVGWGPGGRGVVRLSTGAHIAQVGVGRGEGASWEGPHPAHRSPQPIATSHPATLVHRPAPQVKNKMTVDGFLRNNRGINDGADLPEDFMRALYAR